jgi:hypothetical protein
MENKVFCYYVDMLEENKILKFIWLGDSRAKRAPLLKF